MSSKSKIISFFIRTDASTQMGTGHIMRCLTLAEELRKNGGVVEFVCREHKGNLIDFIREKKFVVHCLPQIKNYNQVLNKQELTTQNQHLNWLGTDWKTDANQTLEIISKKNKKPDWLIVDNYALDYKWEEKLNPFVNKIMVIDDLADRKHKCDLLLDQNFYLKKDRYKNIVPKKCVQLIGPKYALLRKEFVKARKNLRKRDGEIRRIFIFFGGSDPNNETKKALEAIILLNKKDIKVDVVIGALSKHRAEIQKIAKKMPNINCHINVDNMAELMAKSDLAIGAGGSTTWERACLGLPTIVFILAKNQEATSFDMHKRSFFVFADKAEKINKQKLFDIIKMFLIIQKKIKN